MTDQYNSIPAEEPVPAPSPAAEPATPIEPVAAEVTEVKRRKTLSFFAILSFLLGIAIYVWFFAVISINQIVTIIVAPLIALLAILTGHKARHGIRISANDVKGKTAANWGLILGYFFIFFVILLVVLYFMGVVTIPAINPVTGTVIQA